MPVRAISLRMKLVVPFTIPCTRSMCAAASVSWITRITGTTPPTAASKRSWTPHSRAVSKISSPCSASTALLAVTTWRPARIARRMYSRAGSMPPISSTTRWLRSTMSSKSPRLRVRTPTTSGRLPVVAAIESARSSISSCRAAPTVPRASSPTQNGPPGAGVPGREVAVGLAAHHDASVATRAEDHGRPRDAVVVVRHRVPVRPGGRGHEHVTGPRVVEHDVWHEDVARLAMLAGDGAQVRPAEAVGDLRLVARAVEHRPQVVGHPAVARHVRPHVRDPLHRADAVDRHARVGYERAARLAEARHAVGRAAQERVHVVVDRK